MSWKKVKLNEIADLQNGYAFNSEDYTECSNTLNCRMSNIRPDGSFDLAYNPKYLPDDYSEKYSDFLLKDGDLIVAMTDLATNPKILGVPTIVKTNGKRLLLNQRVGKLLLKSSAEIFIPFLKYALSRKEVQGYYAKFSNGGLQINLSKKDLLSYEFKIPSFTIQQKIASILDKADELRRKDKQLPAKYDELLQSIFYKMFGDPVKNERGWEKKKLSECIIFLTSGSRGWAKYYKPTGDLFLRINNITSNELKLDDLVYVDAPDTAETRRIKVKEGDLLLSMTADLGRTAVIPKGFPTAYINQHLGLLRLKQEVDPVFVSQFISSPAGKMQIAKANKGGVKAGLNFDDIKSLEIISPAIELQKRFSNIYFKLKAEKSKAKQLAENSEALFQSLLQRAFKGELVK